MHPDQQKALRQQLASLPNNERLKLAKKASQIRKIRRPKNGPPGRKSTSIDDFMLEILAEESREVARSAATGSGTVVWLGTATCRIRHADGEQECLLPRKGRAGDVAVGDCVTFAPHGTDFIVAGVSPRRTVLSRPDPDRADKELVIAANVDLVVVVAAFVAPALHPRMIDRYLVAIQRGGARPILALTKTDLLTAANRDEELAKLEPYRQVMPIVLCSNESGEGVSEVAALLTGQTCAFVGKSGVGKSTLLNSIIGEQVAATKTVSGQTSKGRHTTTSSTLYDCPNGCRLIDTPGVRTFGLADVDAASLRWYFPEFEEVASDCRYRDCTHSHEPKCAVREAADRGFVNRVRYETYLRILGSL